MKNLTIETPRTIMRQLTEEDAEDFFALNQDPEVLKHTGDQPFESVEAARDFLQKYDQYEKYGVGRLAVIGKEHSKFMGWCGLKYHEETREYDIGFRFFREYWKQGLATETAKACLEFGFKKQGISRIIGRARSENIASIRVLEKLGMTFRETFDFEGHEGVVYRWGN